MNGKTSKNLAVDGVTLGFHRSKPVQCDGLVCTTYSLKNPRPAFVVRFLARIEE